MAPIREFTYAQDSGGPTTGQPVVEYTYDEPGGQQSQQIYGGYGGDQSSGYGGGQSSYVGGPSSYGGGQSGYGGGPAFGPPGEYVHTQQGYGGMATYNNSFGAGSGGQIAGFQTVGGGTSYPNGALVPEFMHPGVNYNGAPPQGGGYQPPALWT